MPYWMILSLAFPMLSYALWRWTNVTRDLLETRRHGAMMAHLDWTRKPDTARRAAPAKGLFSALFR